MRRTKKNQLLLLIEDTFKTFEMFHVGGCNAQQPWGPWASKRPWPAAVFWALYGLSCWHLLQLPNIMPEYPEVLVIIFLILSGKGYNGTLESYRSLKVSFTTSAHSFLPDHVPCWLVYCSNYSALFIARFSKKIIWKSHRQLWGLCSWYFHQHPKPRGEVVARWMASSFLAQEPWAYLLDPPREAGELICAARGKLLVIAAGNVRSPSSFIFLLTFYGSLLACRLHQSGTWGLYFWHDSWRFLCHHIPGLPRSEQRRNKGWPNTDVPHSKTIDRTQLVQHIPTNHQDIRSLHLQKVGLRFKQLFWACENARKVQAISLD